MLLRRHFLNLPLRNFSSKSQENYYDLLKVSPKSTSKQIRDAFLKLSKEKHPDISGKKNHDEFVKIKEAYTILSKEQSRTNYDNSLRQRHYHARYPRAQEAYTGQSYWEQQQNEYNNAQKKSEKEVQQQRARNAIVIIIFLSFTIITFTLQLFFVNRTANKQRQDLENHMKRLRDTRDRAFISQKKKVLEEADAQNELNSLIQEYNTLQKAKANSPKKSVYEGN